MDVDAGLAGLFAFSAFLFATAAAATWARTSLGILTAMASRYATPMLLVWMTLILTVLRAGIVFKPSEAKRYHVLGAGLATALAIVAGTDLRSDLAQKYTNMTRAVQQASYFVVSGVIGDAELATLYYEPRSIPPVIRFMRRNKLNMFASGFGIRTPDTAAFETSFTAHSPAVCSSAAIEAISRLGDTDWRIDGWVMGEHHDAPDWILSLDPTGKVVGFTPPLTPRDDLATAVGADRRFNGFSLPVHLPHDDRTKVSVAAVFGDGKACRVKDGAALP